MELSTRLLVLFAIISISYLSHGFSIKRNEKEENAILSIKRQLLCLLNKDGCKDKINKDQRMYQNMWDKIVYLNGRVYTVDKSTAWEIESKEAIVIDTESGKIEFVGSNYEAEYYITDNSLVYDLHGSVVLPGLHDVHMHPLEAMSPVAGACSVPGDKQPDSGEYINVFKECGGINTGTDWLLGAGFAITEMMDYIAKKPDKSPRVLLDKYVPDRPAAILSMTSHSIWVNSKALKMAGIDKNTTDSPGTVIMRETDGNPNGIILENGAMTINEIAMDPGNYPEMDYLNYDGLLEAIEEISRNGITSICDARLFWKIGHEQAWNGVCEDGYLNVRAVLGAWAYPAEDDDKQIQKLKGMYYSKRDDGCSLKISQIKVYMDGIVESTTAAMEKPYLFSLNLPTISDENIGLNYFDRPRLEKYLKALQAFNEKEDEGYDFHIHAIGDRGIREALDAIQAAAVNKNTHKRVPRHRLTHLEIVNDNDIGRFKRLGVIADFQLSGDFVLPKEASEHLKWYVGKTKADSSIPVRKVAATGAMVTLSSDWDVSTLNPFVGIQYAAQRGTKSITVKQAIEMRTINSAYAMRQEDVVGTLTVGKDADIIVIDKDILKIAVEYISDTEVLQTVFKGSIIYDPDYAYDIIEELPNWWYTYRKRNVFHKQ